jgi:RNA polymerase sigma-70 factor (ECF subfamily)
MGTAQHTEDTDLITRSIAGDEKAFTELVNRYEDTVYRFAFNVCRNEDMASETLSDTFVNVYRKLNTFDNRSKFSTWLYSIVTNNCLMKRRSKKSRSHFIPLENEQVDSEHLTGTAVTPIDSLLEDERKEVLDKAILKLPLDYRIVFVMRDIEGLPASEVSKILGISVPAVKSRLFRAREFLRTYLSPYMEDKV